MKLLFDICHPAHAHFFKHAIARLRDAGHEVLVTSRAKEMALDLLDALQIEHETLSAQRSGTLGLGRELLERNTKLLRTVRRFKPDAMAAIGGIFIAQVGALTRTPSLVFYDTENARLQNALTYPFASRVIVPDCYAAWTPGGRTLRYRGYHELAYLAPDYFRPDRDIAIDNGLAADGDTYLIRVVSWQANHDIGETGWNTELLGWVAEALAAGGRVLISSEAPLPEHLDAYRFRGRPEQLHHVMAFCRGFVGESATMASECAVLGVPAIYAAQTGRGYTDEQQSRYQLVYNVSEVSAAALQPAMDWLTGLQTPQLRASRERLLRESVDVTGLICDVVTGYPETPATDGVTRA